MAGIDRAASPAAPQRIVIDCDPGVDDALAILLALAAPERLELCALTTVAGNVALADTWRNARDLCALAGREDVPVYAGCAGPMLKAPLKRATVHGTDGLGGVSLPGSRRAPERQHAVDFLIDSVLAAPGEIMLCPIGPLTNVALALIKEPRFATALKGLVIMGGAAFCPGNSSPAAEFNVFCDPHAAQVVFESGVPITLFGLDVTRQVRVPSEWVSALDARSGAVGKAAAAMLTAYNRGDPHLHDPCVIAHLLDPTLFGGVDAHVEVDCASGPNRGRTVAAVRPAHLAGRAPNCQVITEVDSSRLLALLMERIGAL